MGLVEGVGWQMSETHGHLPSEQKEILKKEKQLRVIT